MAYKKLIFGLFVVGLIIRLANGEYMKKTSEQLFDYSCKNWLTDAKRGNCSYFGKTLKCIGGMRNLNSFSAVKLKDIDNLIICGWRKIKFDTPNVLKPFKNIKHLRIEYSNITDIEDFLYMPNLEIINITWTRLTTLHPLLFKKLLNLQYLDLRLNGVDFLERPLELPDTFKAMYLSGNPWNCTRNLKWFAIPEKDDKIMDRDALTCKDQKYLGRHLMTVMHFRTILRAACKSNEEIQNCTCTVHYIHRSADGKSLTPIYAVNCSYLGFYNFPSSLPQNTTIFNAIGNQITNLRPLRNNKNYSSVMDVYLDNNKIQTIDVLESGYWFRHFRVLSLKGNQIRKVPVYALDNALENNHNAVKVHLSENPWKCDCKFTIRFRDILMKYHTVIKDSTNVRCNYTDVDGNIVSAQILSLDRDDVCQSPTESKILPLDLVNVILAVLIILVLGTLGYDYYHYKNYGRVPWIVTKLP